MYFTYRIKKDCTVEQRKIVDSYIEQINQKYQYNDDNADYVFIFGGDGTVLKTVNEFSDRLDDIIFVGINFGNLGFYTDFNESKFSNLMETIEEKKYDISLLPLVEYKINMQDKIIAGKALNEVTIINPFKTMVLDVFINNEYFESFRGTGMSISSPSGSTAYNKSLGGAIVDISLNAMQMTEIASINNRVYKTIGSPVIISDKGKITLIPQNSSGTIITHDNIIAYDNNINEEISSVELNISKTKVKLLTTKNHSFFARVKNAFVENKND